MKDEKIYIPCLRWKQGEYDTLFRIPPEKKKRLLPVFDVAEFFKDSPGNSYDHEDRKSSKTVDEHLGKFTKRIALKWGHFECFVDLRHIDETCRLIDGLHPITFVFNRLRFRQVQGIPVIGLNRDQDYKSAVKEVIKRDNRGLCIRANLEKIINPNFSQEVRSLLREMDEEANNCDFIFDLGAPDKFEPISDFINIVERLIKDLPFLNDWRTFGLIGHSIPMSIKDLPRGLSTLPRSEWVLYKKLVRKLESSSLRLPIFGDYAINHPTASNFNGRAIPSTACVRYTINDGWLISKGEIIHGKKGKNGKKTGAGLGQYASLCDLIVKSEYYRGSSFSFGDKYISGCADKTITPGSQSRFRDVGTSHHLEMVMLDLANLASS